jgi:DNA-binding NarL/FixJ family response regulator
MSYFYKKYGMINLSTILSTKENEIAMAICNGKTHKEIANELNISINTLKTHVQHIYKKMNIHSKTELILMHLQPA